jgi:hypothetical protein
MRAQPSGAPSGILTRTPGPSLHPASSTPSLSPLHPSAPAPPLSPPGAPPASSAASATSSSRPPPRSCTSSATTPPGRSSRRGSARSRSGVRASPRSSARGSFRTCRRSSELGKRPHGGGARAPAAARAPRAARSGAAWLDEAGALACEVPRLGRGCAGPCAPHRRVCGAGPFLQVTGALPRAAAALASDRVPT